METDDEPQNTYITLLVAQSDQDTLGCAIIDSGCTKTVVGQNWVI